MAGTTWHMRTCEFCEETFWHWDPEQIRQWMADHYAVMHDDDIEATVAAFVAVIG